MRSRPALGFALLLLSACATDAPHRTPAETDLAATPAWAAPPLERAVSIRDGRDGSELSFDALLDELANADVVFLGETHTDETTHRTELAIYEGLLARRGGRVVLAMEMFERDVQPHVDAYVAGETDEATFLANSRPWGNYGTGYRRLVERARADRRPVVASNFPAPLRRRVGMEGQEGIDKLDATERATVPREFLANSPAYWRRVDNAIRGHLGMMRASASTPDDERLFATQSLWDNSMGESCALALDAHPGHLVLHVNGGFHSEYWDGTVRQLQLRKPDARVRTVSILPTGNPGVSGVSGAPWADYVVFAESRASDVHDGTWSVSVQRSLRYRLHVPPGADAAQPVPLLIWLCDDGLSAADGLDLWKERLGAEVAIAVVEAPYIETQPDGGEGGRWFWPNTFAGDVGTLSGAVNRIWGYLLRNMPVDPERVCLAGEGTGATVVAATALMTQSMDIDAVALAPRRFSKIKDFPLPLPEFRGDDPAPDKSLQVFSLASDAKWWIEELTAYTAIGFDARFAPMEADPWSIEAASEAALRNGLGLPPRTAPEVSSRRFILLPEGTPRARHWARLRALRDPSGDRVAVVRTIPDDDSALRVDLDVRAADFAADATLPPCPGPFGGTTVVVLPKNSPAAEIESWLALEKDDPLARRNRFLRLRVATTGGSADRSLPAVLEKLESERRRNILIVPAAFCADVLTMRELARVTRPFEDRMTLHWLPGLGGR